MEKVPEYFDSPHSQRTCESKSKDLLKTVKVVYAPLSSETELELPFAGTTNRIS